MLGTSEKNIALFVSILNGALENIEGTDAIIDRAMEAVFEESYGWMITDDDTRFKTAVVAAYTKVCEEDQKRIKVEMDNIRNLSALMSGVPINLDAIAEEMEEHEPLHLMDRYKKSKSEGEGVRMSDKQCVNN